ncbi:MAG: hypothetical protein ABFD81_11565 [Syntrophaceae bacterium]
MNKNYSQKNTLLVCLVYFVLIAGEIFFLGSEGCSMANKGQPNAADKASAQTGAAQTNDITSKGASGKNIIALKIIEPKNGTTTHHDTLWVRGTVSSKAHGDVGVAINGLPAHVYGDQFFMHHVILEPGNFQINVKATDSQGNVQDAQVGITMDYKEPPFLIEMDDYAGMAPFETTLRIQTDFTPEKVAFSDTGRGRITYLERVDQLEQKIRVLNGGIYFITATMHIQGVSIPETIGFIVYDQQELDRSLRRKWDAMRTALMKGDINAAEKDISSRTQSSYLNVFSTLTPEKRASIAADLADLQLIKMSSETSIEYDIRTKRNDKTYSHILLFEKDSDGLWKIARF